MKFNRVICAAGAVLLLGRMVPADAQRDQQGGNQGKSDKQERAGQSQQQKQGKPQRARQPVQQQQRQRAQQQVPQRTAKQPRWQQPQRTQQQAQTWQQQRGWVAPGAWQGHDSWQENRARNWASDHRTWSQRGGYGGYYIAWDRFSLSFGRQHFFRLRSRPVIYGGYPRFEYGGFAFQIVDPWPEFWSENWYGCDDVYIDYDDGYYLFNNRYPQVRLAITVVL